MNRPKSVRLDPPNWIDFAQFEPGLEPTLPQSNASHTKSTVNLGEKQVDFDETPKIPSRLTLSQLLSYQNGIIGQYILNSNTLFHGKVGFYELIIRRILSLEGKSTRDLEYVNTAQNLPRERMRERLILLPNVTTEDDVNDFVARSLRHKLRIPVWLVATPYSIRKHLLLGFHNFFITSNNNEEINYLQSVFSLPKRTVDLLLSNEREAVFISDFEPIINKVNLPIAIVRLEQLY